MRTLGFVLGLLFILFFSYGLIFQKLGLSDYIFALIGLLSGTLFFAYGVKGNRFITPILQKLLLWGSDSDKSTKRKIYK